MRTIRVRPLERHQIALCFPLAHLAVPELTSQSWEFFTEGHLGLQHPDRNGILVAEVENGCILGLVIYQFDRHPVQGRTLLVKNLIAHDYFTSGRKSVEQALIEAVESLAQRRGCKAVHILMPLREAEPRRPGLRHALEAHGHSVNGLSFCKPLDIEDAEDGAAWD